MLVAISQRYKGGPITDIKDNPIETKILEAESKNPIYKVLLTYKSVMGNGSQQQYCYAVNVDKIVGNFTFDHLRAT